MSKLVWDEMSKRQYTTGISKGVLFVHDGAKYGNGVSWSGLTSVEENPSGGEPQKYYADNIAYFTMTTLEEIGATIGCYYYPDEWKECDGLKSAVPGFDIAQQDRKMFAIAYRTEVRSATGGSANGYEIHVLLGATASPTARTMQTINENVEPTELSYTVTTISQSMDITLDDGTVIKPSSLMKFNSLVLGAEKMKLVEDVLYGTDDEESHLLTPAEFYEMLKAAA